MFFYNLEYLMSQGSSTTQISSKSLLVPTINSWEIYLKDQGNSIHTIKAFTHDLQLLATYISPDRSIGNIATTDLNNFLDWMQKGRGVPCSPKTLARRITSIKAFFRWLHKYGVLTIDPSEKLVQKSVISPLPTILTMDDVYKILEIAHKYRHSKKPDTRYITLFSLLINSGIKKSETLNLRTNHIDLENPESPIVFVRYASPKNRYRERKVLLPKEWLTYYAEYKIQFNIIDRVFPWSQRRLEYLLEDLSNEAGIEKHLSFDMCRWTCALFDWQAGMEKDKIRQKLGISKIQWREIKMKLQRLTLQKA